MSLEVFCDAQPGDKLGWQRFVLAHRLRHRTYIDSLSGATICDAEVHNITVDDLSWMLRHYQAHIDVATALGMSNNPNVQYANLQDATQFVWWMQQHKLEHENFDNALNL